MSIARNKCDTNYPELILSVNQLTFKKLRMSQNFPLIFESRVLIIYVIHYYFSPKKKPKFFSTRVRQRASIPTFTIFVTQKVHNQQLNRNRGHAIMQVICKKLSGKFLFFNSLVQSLIFKVRNKPGEKLS